MSENFGADKLLGAVWAQDSFGGIGADGGLLWHIPEDLKVFKKITEGSTVVMGKNTWVSLPDKFKPLVGRENFVVSSSLDEVDGMKVFSNIYDAVEAASNDVVWFIGGSRVYVECLPLVDVLHITRVDAIFEDADVFAPSAGLIEESFVLDDVSERMISSKSGLGFTFESWVRNGD